MKMEERSIGFDRKIPLPWINAVADWAAAGYDKQQINAKLDQLLEGKVAGSNSGSAKGKTKTVLLHVWVSVPPQVEPLREDALRLLREHSGRTRLALHWGMCLATYPFFRSIAETVGRLLRLQESASVAQVRRRTEEQFGERQVVPRALQRVLRTFAEWGVLRATSEKGVYTSAPPRMIEDGDILAWLIEATLVSNGSNTGMLQSILQSPALFPFNFNAFNFRSFENHKRLEWYQQSIDQHIIAIRTPLIARQ